MVRLVMILLLTNFTGGSVQPSQDYGSIIGELQQLEAAKTEDRDLETDPEIKSPQKILNNLFKSLMKSMILRKSSDHSIFWQ